jgi:hypothetical protein
MNRLFIQAFFPTFLLLRKLHVSTTYSKKTFWNFSLQVMFKSILSLYSNFADYENFNNDPQEKKIQNCFPHLSLAKNLSFKIFSRKFQKF